MHSQRRRVPSKPSHFSRNKVTSRKIKSYEPKDVNETMLSMRRKKKSHYFTHSAEDAPNSNPHFNQRERMRVWEKDPHRE